MTRVQFNVRKLAVSELIAHISSYKRPETIYTDIRRFSRKDLMTLERAVLWAFLVTIDPGRYISVGEAVPDRRRARK